MLTHARNLADEPFFAGMAPALLETLAEHGHLCRFDQGQYIFKEGESATHFYIITGGRLALENEVPGREGVQRIETVGEWEALGWSWLIPPYRTHFSAVALTPVEAIAFDAVLLRELCERDHHLGYEMMKRFVVVLFQRLIATRFEFAQTSQP